MTDVLVAPPRRCGPRHVLGVRLRNGGVATLRPLSAGEVGPLEEVFAGMSPGSRALRYLTGMPQRLPPHLAASMADLDGDRHVAWMARVDGRAAGVARYDRSPDHESAADFAVEVVDCEHGRGLATALLDALTTVAWMNGVRTIRGTLLPTNEASRRLLTRFGAVTRLDDGLLEAEGPLRLLEEPVTDRLTVVRLASEARVDDRTGCFSAP
jgi:RimJ/RimL family protein N-acetyltransferase